MLSVELITSKFEVYPQEKNTKRSFLIEADSIFLIFADEVDNKVYQFIKQIISYGIHIIILSPKQIENKFIHHLVTYITINKRYYIHTFLLDPFIIKFVSGFGEIGKRIAKIFSQFNCGVEIDIIYEPNQLQNYLGNEKSILIKTLDGIGDLLMAIPTAKTYFEKGYLVDFLVWEGREDVLKNAPYIRNVFNQNKKIKLSNYSRFFDISFHMSDYGNKKCCQHRIFTTAELCGLKKEEVVIDRPEIFLVSDMIEETKKKFYCNFDVLVCFSSFDKRRTIPLEVRQNFINQLNNPTVIDTEFCYYKNCNNFTGKTSIRELFALIFLHRRIITVDTSVLHIAGAFEKETLLLPSTVNSDWRVYKNTKVLKPECKNFPCNENNRNCDLSCLKNFDYEKIKKFIK